MRESIKTSVICLIILILVCISSGCATLNPSGHQNKTSSKDHGFLTTTSSVSLIPTLNRHETPAIYFGVYVPQSRTEELKNLAAFENDARKNVSVVTLFQHWGSPDDGSFDPALMQQIRNHGAIPLVTWEPRDPKEKDQAAYSLKHIINGDFDTYIRTYALAAKAWGHPFFLRFGHEMNGNWYPWSEQVNGNTKGEYVQAWRHVHDIFTDNGVTNVTWVWCPSRNDISPYGLKELYPGDEYVDWLGIDGYNQPGSPEQNGNYESFSEVFSGIYRKITEISGKPVIIAETASVEGTPGQKAAWITDALSTQIPQNFTHVHAIMWLNINFGGPRPLDWTIESSQSSQHAFAAAIASPVYASNTYSALEQLPVL